MAQFFVSANAVRPDYRLVIAFLWNDLRRVDTDGDACNPASRDWTELYLRNRKNAAEFINVVPATLEPLVLCIESPLEYLAARAAYCLAEFMAAGVSSHADGPFETPASLVSKVGAGFNLETAMMRAKTSRFAKSTPADPYP